MKQSMILKGVMRDKLDIYTFTNQYQQYILLHCSPKADGDYG